MRSIVSAMAPYHTRDCAGRLATCVAQGGGAAELKPRYFAVIGATAQQVDAGLLTVRDSQLCLGPAPFDKYDYMLFRVEGRSERDDWRFGNT